MKKILIILSLIVMPYFAMATTQPTFTEGKQYKVVDLSPSTPTRFQIPKDKVLVVEFFSYGCPWCFHLEPSLEKWLKTKPSYVKFERVPVTFEHGWQAYAKAYYTAEALGVLKKITPAIFNAIHVKDENLTSAAAMQKFFEKEGVSKADFESAYDFSPGIGMELERSQKLMMAYKIFAIPAIVVNGKYYTNASMTDGNDKLMMHVVNYLVEKEKPKATNEN